jgi:hypothetical protein
MSARTTTFLTAAAIAAVACSGEQAVAPELPASFRSAAPSGTSVFVGAYNRLAVYWQDNSPNETGYEVHRATGPSGAFALIVSLPAGSTSYTNIDLTAETEYCYRVRAFRRTGKTTTYAEFSNTACATTPRVPVPGAPSGVSAAPDQWNRIRIAWTQNSADETGFRVKRASSTDGPLSVVATVTANVVSAFDEQPPAFEQPACYHVVAFNGFGESPVSNVACTSRPAAPTALVTATSGSDVDLSWIDNSNVEDAYQVERWTDESGAREVTVVAILPANATAYRDAGLADGTYWYQVHARRDGGTTGSSNNASASVVTMPPAAPTGVNAQPSSSSVAYVVWTDNSTNETGFRIERSIDGGGSWVAAGTAILHPYWPEPQFADGGQPSEQHLCYRVIALNSLGESPPSNTDCTMLPLGPTSLTATGVSPQTIELAWIDNSAVEDGYDVYAVIYYCSYYDEWGYCVWEPYPELIATLGPNATTFQHTGLIQGEARTYFVVALKDGGRSDASNEAAAYVP